MKLRRQSNEITELTVSDVNMAQTDIIRMLQWKHFKSDFESLQRADTQVKRNSSLVRLDPFDNDGLRRVGGRLQKS